MTNPKDAKEKGAPAVLWGLICLLDCAWELRWKASSQKRRLLTRADFPLPSTVGLRLGSAERERAEERARFWDLIVEAAGKDRNARLDLHEVCKLVEAVWQDLTREVREDERFEDVDCDWAKRPTPGPQGDNWKDRYADYLGLRDSIVEYRGKLKAILRRWKAIRERKQGPPKTRAEFLGRKLGPPSLEGDVPPAWPAPDAPVQPAAAKGGEKASERREAAKPKGRGKQKLERSGEARGPRGSR